MGTENRAISRYEVTAVYTHPEAKADIILVHGLNGEPDTTWTAKDGKTFWPLDLLPTALKSTHANILVYGYNADVYSKRYDRTTSNHFINQHAEDLVTNLTLHRRSQGISKNPIIWVCHSLGGILVKRALLYSHDVRETHLEDLGAIYVSTFGLIFLGTPHVGSDAAAWAVMIQAMANALIPRRFFDSEPVLLKTLRKDNETLVNISSHFLDIYQRFEVHMVRENQKTDIQGKRFFVVDANSAAPPLPGVTYYGIEANHADMCKYDSIHSPGFRNIAITLHEWVEKAPFLIHQRWLAEEDEGRHRALARVDEIMGIRPSQHSSRVSHEDNEPQFVGRTSHFIGDMSIQEYRGSSLSYMTQHVKKMSEGCTEENPFPGASPIPSMDIANANWPCQHWGLIHGSGHSEASLNTGPGYWAPDLPINTNLASYPFPLPGHLQGPSCHQRTLTTDGFLSPSLPNSFARSTLQPPLAAVGGYAPQPTSCQSSPISEAPFQNTFAFPRSSYAPSIIAIGPSPLHEATPANNVPLGYQACQSRQPGLLSFYDAPHGDTVYSPRQDMSFEGTEMMTSGSELIRFNGNLVEFGQSEHKGPQTVHPSEIESPPPENQDTRQQEMKIQTPDYNQSLMPE